jgi:hypothetical protein
MAIPQPVDNIVVSIDRVLRPVTPGGLSPHFVRRVDPEQ